MNTASKLINILIADECLLYGIALKTIVQKAWNVKEAITVSNGKEVVSTLKTKEFSVVFLDINLPVVNMDQCCKLIMASYPETKIIAISSHDDHYIIQKAFNAGCMGFVLKTEGEIEILEALETVRNGRKYFGNKIPDILLNRKKENEIERESNLLLFSENELAVLKAICLEKSNHEITNLVFRSIRTIEGYRRKIYRKANTNNPVGLIRFAIRNGFVTQDEI